MVSLSSDVSGKARRVAHELRFAFGVGRVDLASRFDLGNLDLGARFFREHGWVLLRGVFTPAEIDGFRRDVLASERDGDVGDLLSNPRLARVVTDDRVIRAARALLGGKPTYFADSSWYSSNTHPYALGFHKDNADKFTPGGPDWQGEYPILRMGIYLQDHADHSGGLALRDRSHHTTDCTVGQPFAVPTRPGDIIVWSFRTSHSGFVSRPRLFPKVFLPLTVQNALTGGGKKYRPPPALFRPIERAERLALFMSFGVDGKHLRRYVEYMKTRRFALVLWQNSRYTDAMRAAFPAKGVGFVDAPRQAAGIDLASASEEHHDPPPGMPVPEAPDETGAPT